MVRTDLSARLAGLAVVLYYFAPLIASVILAQFVPSYWKFVVVGFGLAWPLGNVLIGVMKGCD